MNRIDRRIQEYQAQHNARERMKRVELRNRTYQRMEEMLGREALDDLKPTFTESAVWVTIPRRFWLPLVVSVTATKHGLELNKGLEYATVETAEEFWLKIGEWK